MRDYKTKYAVPLTKTRVSKSHPKRKPIPKCRYASTSTQRRFPRGKLCEISYGKKRGCFGTDIQRGTTVVYYCIVKATSTTIKLKVHFQVSGKSKGASAPCWPYLNPRTYSFYLNHIIHMHVRVLELERKRVFETHPKLLNSR